jgi:hypothetical protein
MFARDHEHTVRGHNAEEHAYDEAKFRHRKGVPEPSQRHSKPA